MSQTLSTVFTVILLAGALIAGAAQLAFWVIVVIALFATLANVVSPTAKAARAKQGKTLGQALPALVLNQLIWVNLVFLVGYGAAWMLDGPLFALPVWVALAISGVGLAGILAVSAKG